MTTSQPGPDEVRVRHLLVKNGVGPHGGTQPAAPPIPRRPPVPPRPPAPPVPAHPAPAVQAAPAQKKPKAKQPKPAKAKKPAKTKSPSTKAGTALNLGWASTAAAKAKTTVAGRLPEGKLLNKPAIARTAYWASAAAVGWSINVGPWLLACLNYYWGGGFYGTAVLVVIALIILTIDSRTHSLRGPGRHAFVRAIGWMTRIPLATALLAIALYKTR